MKHELKHGQALVLVGPSGGPYAREIASRYGSYVEMEAQHLACRFRLGWALRGEPKTVIAEGPLNSAVIQAVKGMVASPEVMVECPREEPRIVQTPSFIFCTENREALGVFRADRRFRVCLANGFGGILRRKGRTVDITEVTEEMVDRVMPPEDDGYPSCPLCDYTGHWNCTMGTREDQRSRVRELLEQALGLTPNAGLPSYALTGEKGRP